MRNPHKASNVNTGPSADDRFTPRYLITALHKEFRFTLDPCGNVRSPVTDLIPIWTGQGEYDALRRSWRGERMFVNPPFSQIPAWAEKATREVHDYACPLVVMLLPWNRQEQPWWQRYIEPHRDGRQASLPMRIQTTCIQTIALGGGQYGVKGRVKYGTPADPEGVRPHNNPNFGSGLVIWQRI